MTTGTCFNDIDGPNFLDLAEGFVGKVKEDADLTGNLEIEPIHRESGESDKDWSLRQAAHHHFQVGQVISNIMMSAQAGIALHVRRAVDGQYHTITHRDRTGRYAHHVDGSRSPRQALRDFLEEQRLIDAMGDPAISSLLTFLCETVPMIEQHGYEVKNGAIAQIMDQSGALSMPVVARRSYDATIHARRNGGMSRELAGTLARHINAQVQDVKALNDDLKELGIRGRKEAPEMIPGRYMVVSQKRADPETGEISEQPGAGAEIVVLPDMTYVQRNMVMQAVRSFRIEIRVLCENDEEARRAEKELGAIVDLRHDYT